jgi:hypothetical protein
VRGPTDEHPVAHDAAGDLHGQVVLAEVQHVGLRAEGDVGAVVDRPQPAVPAGGVGEHLAQRELLARLEPLLPQLYDVDAGRQHGVEELDQVALPSPAVGAQVEPRIGEPGGQRHVTGPAPAPAASPRGRGSRRGRRPGGRAGTRRA